MCYEGLSGNHQLVGPQPEFLFTRRHKKNLSFNGSLAADDCALLRYLIYTERVCPEHLSAVAMHNDNASKTDLITSGRLPQARRGLELKSMLSKLLLCGEVRFAHCTSLSENRPTYSFRFGLNHPAKMFCGSI